MDYTSLRRLSLADRERTVDGLKRLRRGLDNNVPKKGPGSLLLATWNIRELGGNKYGDRMRDAEFFIAECMNHFDLIAVQEVRRNLNGLKNIMRILGPQWDCIFNDVSYADGGNSERLAFVFDKNQVFFTGLAGELVLSPEASKHFAQVARTPFVCGFQSGWAKFNLCTVHIYYGEGDENPRRVGEIEEVAKLLKKKAKDYIETEKKLAYSPQNLVLLGDFNIADKTQKTFEALTKSDFVIPKPLQKIPEGSNVKQDKHYDQIAFFKDMEGISSGAAGIFNFFNYVYRDEDDGLYQPYSSETNAKNHGEWRTFQMSDHLIMWCQFDVDKADTYLDEVLKGDDAPASESKPKKPTKPKPKPKKKPKKPK
jgi:endonuclease/exonuclease/phosphatase family metal-dependent hydrolase